MAVVLRMRFLTFFLIQQKETDIYYNIPKL